MPRITEIVPVVLPLLVMLIVWVSVAAWAYAAIRWRRGQPLAPYQPRRPVPWRAFDVAMALGLYLFLPAFVFQVAGRWLDTDIAAPLRHGLETEQRSTAHPLAQVLQNDQNAWAIAVCLVLAVVVTPVIEELLFRLLVQGWLERVERRMRRRLRRMRWLAAGIVPVTTSAFFFAALHFRAPVPQFDTAALLVLFQVRIVADLLTIALVLCWLRLVTQASLADLGVAPGRSASDVKLGLLAFAMVIAPIYGFLLVVRSLLPEDVVADPLPIFLLAIVLGGLYWRTHRLVPSIVLHMAFNAIGVLFALGMPQ